MGQRGVIHSPAGCDDRGCWGYGEPNNAGMTQLALINTLDTYNLVSPKKTPWLQIVGGAYSILQIDATPPTAHDTAKNVNG